MLGSVHTSHLHNENLVVGRVIGLGSCKFKSIETKRGVKIELETRRRSEGEGKKRTSNDVGSVREFPPLVSERVLRDEQEKILVGQLSERKS